jgi:hypothetical protein
LTNGKWEIQLDFDLIAAEDDDYINDHMQEVTAVSVMEP